jgi:hypothetical protein
MIEPPTDSALQPTPSLARRAAAVVVGLFAIWQLVYLPAANLIDLVPRRTGPLLEPIPDMHQEVGTFTEFEPLQRAADCTGDVLDFWSELSGQEQGWSLFAPKMPEYSVFPAAELEFADGTTETLLSPYEPSDRIHPAARLPLVDNRPFNVEAQLMYPVWIAPPEDVAALYWPPRVMAQLPEVYRTLPETARVWRGVIQAWLSWRMEAYMVVHPERGRPIRVVLKHRFVPSPKPGEPAGWMSPTRERPFARWHPADNSFEAYDVLAGCFKPVGEKP